MIDIDLCHTNDVEILIWLCSRSIVRYQDAESSRRYRVSNIGLCSFIFAFGLMYTATIAIRMLRITYSYA